MNEAADLSIKNLKHIVYFNLSEEELNACNERAKKLSAMEKEIKFNFLEKHASSIAGL